MLTINEINKNLIKASKSIHKERQLQRDCSSEINKLFDDLKAYSDQLIKMDAKTTANEFNEKKKENDQKTIDLSRAIFLSKCKEQVYINNFKYYICCALPYVKEIINGYAGKKYGEKTRQNLNKDIESIFDVYNKYIESTLNQTTNYYYCSISAYIDNSYNYSTYINIWCNDCCISNFYIYLPGKLTNDYNEIQALEKDITKEVELIENVSKYVNQGINAHTKTRKALTKAMEIQREEFNNFGVLANTVFKENITLHNWDIK